MSMLKFRKQISMSYKNAIETALRDATGGVKQNYEAKVGLTIEGLELKHTAIGKMKG